MNPILRVQKNVDPQSVPRDRDRFLSELEGPTLFSRQGLDSTRLRVVSGLLHGNEPSGLHAIHRALLEPDTPCVDCLFFVGAVHAAQKEPLHSHRTLPGRRDLNRCFGKAAEDLDTRIAAAALTELTERTPEAALDLHNNSGHNPAYSVLLSLDARRLGLAELFAKVHVFTDFRMGTIMDELDSICPTVTIECGHAGAPEADELAWRGVRAFLYNAELAEADPSESTVLSHPLRVKVAEGVSVAFGSPRGAAEGLVLRPDVDRHNFQKLEPGTLIGLVHDDERMPLVAKTAAGHDLSEALFECRDGELRVRRRLTPMMMTTDPVIAHGDCLFWAFVDELDERPL